MPGLSCSVTMCMELVFQHCDFSLTHHIGVCLQSDGDNVTQPPPRLHAPELPDQSPNLAQNADCPHTVWFVSHSPSLLLSMTFYS